MAKSAFRSWPIIQGKARGKFSFGESTCSDERVGLIQTKMHRKIDNSEQIALAGGFKKSWSFSN